MRIDYRYLIQEIESMTTLDGFVSTCLEIRDSMLFYDKELLLTAFGSTLELLVVSALYWSGLESEQDLQEANERMNTAMKNLRSELSQSVLPMDVHYLGEQYLRGNGWALELRSPLYVKTFSEYINGSESSEPVDVCLQRAQELFLRGENKEALGYTALVGAQVLRGAHIRPIWFRVGHPRLQLHLAGLQTMANNFSVAPYFSFPFEDVTTERKKRKRNLGGTVVDLGAFRNFRRDAAGYTDRRIVIEPDDLDRCLERLQEDDVDIAELRKSLEPYRSQVIPILQGAAKAWVGGGEDEPLISRRALQILTHWGEKATADAALDVLVHSDPWDSMFQESLHALQTLGHKAVPAVRRFTKERPEGPLPILLADTLSRGRPSKRVTSLLRELFERSQWGKGREVIGAALARMGGPEEVAYLRRIMDEDPAEPRSLMDELQTILDAKEEKSRD